MQTYLLVWASSSWTPNGTIPLPSSGANSALTPDDLAAQRELFEHAVVIITQLDTHLEPHWQQCV
ncbi:MAG: hypothetical protein N2595_06015 [bacterium]|nr:hypothetical protein [bacterium]